MEKITTIIVFALLAYHAECVDIIEKCQGYNDYNNGVKEEIINNIHQAYQLAIDYNSNNLFFSHSTVKNGSSVIKSSFVSLRTGELKFVKGIEGAFANTVDQKNHIVYLGGKDGIYTVDFNDNFAKHVEGTSQNIWQMFYKNNLYFSTYPEEEVYVFKNGKTQRIPQLLHTKGMLVALDNFDNIYFANSSGLFVHDKDSQKANDSISFVGDYVINGFTSDMKGNLFFSTPTTIYSINDKNKSVKKMVELDDVFGVAVDRHDNFIYATEDSIVRLNPNKHVC